MSETTRRPKHDFRHLLPMSLSCQKHYYMVTQSHEKLATDNEVFVRVKKSDYRLLAVGRVWEVYASLQSALFTWRAQEAVLSLKAKQ